MLCMFYTRLYREWEIFNSRALILSSISQILSENNTDSESIYKREMYDMIFFSDMYIPKG